MARNENPPFGRGDTFYNGATINSSDLGGLNHEGKEWWFEDVNITQGTVGAHTLRTNRLVRCRCVRNVSGAALLPSRLVSFQASGINYGARVDGYADVTAQRGYPVDEWLPAAGVPNNDLFWIVIEGPALCLTPLVNTDFNGTVAEGQVMVALTAATSGATTAGRVACQNITGSSAATDYSFLLNQAENYVGRALSAMSTGNTAATILVEVGHW